MFGGYQMDKSGLNTNDFLVNGLKAGKQLLGAKVAQSIDGGRRRYIVALSALKSSQVQCHCGGKLGKSLVKS